MAERLLYLVRHAEVITSDDVASTEWPLSERGRAAARELAAAGEWRSLDNIVSSPEPKAHDTAAAIAEAAGLELRTEPDLREVERDPTPIVSRDEYRAHVAAHLAEPDRSAGGWERGADARARVVSCVDRVLAETDGQLAVVSHGLLLSHYLAHVRGLEHPDVDEWRAIPIPAVAVVRLDPPRLVAGFTSVGRFLARG